MRLRAALLIQLCAVLPVMAAMVETNPNLKDLPKVPEGFEVTLFARDPMVRNPCSIAFDMQGRMFIGTGPQYRNPKPETPPDSVVMVTDANGDGVADKTHTFATGFNCIQGLAWHGRDLWVANAPDLTLVRDVNGDDVADEYVRIYTDLGNIEHGLHGLNWAPDGKLYMSKGNSKGRALNERLKDDPERVAPQAFRELWGVKGPPDAPAIPPAKTFTPQTYKNTYHDPRDDWGQQGGVLRCDDLGANLEIVTRGLRNPWDIAFDAGFNWLGTDNDQNHGDRIFMSFYGANFGWSHKWSAGWTGENHPPTVPISGPVWPGSGTGILFANSPAYPKAFQNVWLINDWLNKKTLLYRPVWDGALLLPKDGKWEEFIDGKEALYRPTDMEFGPDGALYVLGWGRGYGLEVDKEGKMTNEGRIFRVSAKGAKAVNASLKKITEETVDELIAEFDGVIIARHSAAQDELVKRGVKDDIVAALKSGKLSEAQETWCAWALARQGVAIPHGGGFGNLALQAIRARAAKVEDLANAEPRLRFAAIQSAHQRRQKELGEALIELLAKDTDRLCFYATWNALEDLLGVERLKGLLKDSRPAVRQGVFMALMNLGGLQEQEILALSADKDGAMRTLVSLALGHDQDAEGRPLKQSAYPLATNIKAESKHRCSAGTLRVGERTYTDRKFVFKAVPALLNNASMIQTANEDDKSTGEKFLSFTVPLETVVHVAHDFRIKERPAWLREFADSDLTIENNDTTYRVWSKEFPAGQVTLGGNSDVVNNKGQSQYFVVLQPKPLAALATLTTAAEVEAMLAKGDAKRGEALFHAAGAANCATCHRVGDQGVVFGPELTNLGARMEPKYIIQSILEPNAVITEGFSAHVVEADGKSWFGILVQQTGDSLTVGLPGGGREKVQKKSLTRHEVVPASPMPLMAALLGPQDVADLVAYLRTEQPVTPVAKPVEAMSIQAEERQLRILLGQKEIATYLMKSDIIQRPGFTNIRTAKGNVVTRPFPVQEDAKNGGDHPDMHPGIWLGFGDINGVDFWRNKGRVEHVKFTKKPSIENGAAKFAVLNRYLSPEGGEVCQQTMQAVIRLHPQGWRMTVETELWNDAGNLSLGAQEEMGLGVRMAATLNEKVGSGLVRNSVGDRGAKMAWGRGADWWDYSGPGGKIGVLVMAAPSNSLKSWGHTRDYGVMVINPTPREPPKNRTVIPQGQHLKLKYEVLIHETEEVFKAEAATTELIK